MVVVLAGRHRSRSRVEGDAGVGRGLQCFDIAGDSVPPVTHAGTWLRPQDKRTEPDTVFPSSRINIDFYSRIQLELMIGGKFQMQIQSVGSMDPPVLCQGSLPQCPGEMPVRLCKV